MFINNSVYKVTHRKSAQRIYALESLELTILRPKGLKMRCIYDRKEFFTLYYIKLLSAKNW